MPAIGTLRETDMAGPQRAASQGLDVITMGRASVDLYGQQIGSRLEDVVMSTVIIPNVADARAVMDYVGERFRGIDPARTVTCSPLGAADFKVEIEVTAYRGAGDAEQERITVSL